jgi:hypothetical protein
MTDTQRESRPGTSFLSDGTDCVRRAATSAKVSTGNGKAPVTISNKSTPKE